MDGALSRDGVGAAQAAAGNSSARLEYFVDCDNVINSGLARLAYKIMR